MQSFAYSSDPLNAAELDNKLKHKSPEINLKQAVLSITSVYTQRKIKILVKCLKCQAKKLRLHVAKVEND